MYTGCLSMSIKFLSLRDNPRERETLLQLVNIRNSQSFNNLIVFSAVSSESE